MASLAEILARLGAGRPAPHLAGFAFGPLGVAVAADRPRLVAELASYFAEFAAPPGRTADLTVKVLEMPAPEVGLAYIPKEPDPGKPRVKEEYLDFPDGRLVRKRLTGLVFAFNQTEHYALGPCLANLNQVVNFINSRLIQHALARGALLAHAAGVHHGGRGLALAGFAGMGKSTLALALMSQGADFVSNDRLLVETAPGGRRMVGVPKLPRINPGTALNNPHLAGVIPSGERAGFARLAGEALWKLERKYDVDLAKCFGRGRFRLASPLNALAILNWRREGGPCRVAAVELASRRDLLAAFVKSPGVFFLPPSPAPDFSAEAYLAALAGVRVCEVTGGVDFPGAARALLARLAAG